MLKKYFQIKGFTMIETLVAIAILMIAIAGPLAISRLSLSASTSASDVLTASYLASDAFEYLKNYKDTLKKNNQSIGTSFDACLAAGGCKIDSVTGGISSCTSTSGSLCEILRYATSTAFYNYSNGDYTQFKRRIRMTSIGGGNEYAVEITIYYGKNFSDIYVLKANIFNYY